MTNTVKNSIFIPSQLPEWIRDDPNYANFVTFIQAYYEWMEQSGNVLDYAKNIPTYMDIDSTTDQFMDYFANDFLQYFPQDVLVSKSTAIKLARELYQSKGTPAAYKLLFRILYDSDFDIAYTRDSVFRASSGTWYVTRSLRLLTNDPNFLSIAKYRILGKESKAIAVIENSVLVGEKTEVFVSNIERVFQTGEYVTVVDNELQPIKINGQYLTSVIVGQISQINIDPNYTGLFYNPGDPVVLYGGLNQSIQNPTPATAVIGTTTQGQLKSIRVNNEGYGYTNYPDTMIIIPDSGSANAIVNGLDPDPSTIVKVKVITDDISPKVNIKLNSSNYGFSNITVSNANTTLINAFSFSQFSTYPLSSVLLVNPGGNITQIPQITAKSTYKSLLGTQENISDLGILGPIKISNGGVGYIANDIITFTGGRGYGANAVVNTVDANGTITSVKFVPRSGFGLGCGFGYNSTNLPTLNVSSSNTSAYGASLYIPGILGEGATFSASSSGVGSIQTINITNAGEDYIGAPFVSLRIQDILVSNTTISNLPVSGDIVGQGADYSANVDSIHIVSQDRNNPLNSLYSLRVYDYNTQPNTSAPLLVKGKNISFKLANTAYPENYFYPGSPQFNSSGIKNYGDGLAQATAQFLNGVVVSQGQYLDTTGQPSSYSVLQSQDYNNFTYKITVEKEIAKYRNVLLDLLHPTGLKFIGRYALKSNSNYNLNISESFFTGKTLQSYTGNHSSNVSIYSSFTNMSNNVIKFNNLAGANIANFIFTGQIGIPNSVLEITNTNSPNVKAQVIAVDYVANTVTINENLWLTYPNVAYVTARSGSNQINILSVTNAYDIINNGIYSNTKYPMMDIVYAGDTIKLGSNTYSVKSVNYVGGIIYTTTNFASNVANSLLSVNRTYNSSQVKIYGAVGLEYIPELTTENGDSITTEDGKILILE
jgi:hypothetical protein